MLPFPHTHLLTNFLFLFIVRALANRKFGDEDDEDDSEDDGVDEDDVDDDDEDDESPPQSLPLYQQRESILS